MLTPLNSKLIFEENIKSIQQFFNTEKLKNKRIFITGGTGFFGIWLLSAIDLLNQNFYNIEVCVLSRDSNTFLNKYPHLINKKWLNFAAGDIKNFIFPDKSFDFIIHGATETSLAAHADPQRMLDDIFFGTRHLLKFAESLKVKKILFISSGAVYGSLPDNSSHILDDSLNACNTANHKNAYGEGKRMMELMGAMIQERIGIESVSARCFSFGGPAIPLNSHYAFGNFVRDALFRDEIIINGDGLTKRSYLHGADLSVWLLNILSNGIGGQTYNVGSDFGITINDLAILIRDLLSPNKHIVYANNELKTSATSKNYVPSVERAKSLGCEQWTSLDNSILQTAKYYS